MTQFLNIETNEVEYAPITELVILQKYLYKIHRHIDTFINSIIFITKEQANYIVLCDDCNEIINTNTDDYYTTSDNRIICESCYCNDYFTCDECGDIHHYNDLVVVNSNTDNTMYVCRDCIETNNRYYICDDCGQAFTALYINYDDCGSTICNSCMTDYCRCSMCGRLIPYNDSYSNDDINNYCYDCYQEVIENTCIHSYGYTPALVYRQVITDIAQPTYYGLEIEVAGNKTKAKDFLDIFPDNHVYLTYDSSVDGFEITTHPMTYDYLHTIFKAPLQKAMDYLRHNNFKGYNEGGVHIHISKTNITSVQYALLHVLIYNNRDSQQANQLLTITQRLDSNLKYYADPYTSLNKLELFNEALLLHKGEKYTAINNLHPNTYEFRIFNSNLRIDRIFKNIEFVQALLDFTSQYNNVTSEQVREHLNEITLDNVFDFVEKSNKYPNLLNFLYEKDLLKNPVTQLTLVQAA